MRTPSLDPNKRRPPRRLRALVEVMGAAIRVQGDVWAKQASLRTQTILASLINVSSHVLLPRASQLYRGSVAEVLGRGAEGNPLYAGRAARAKATRCRPGGVGS